MMEFPDNEALFSVDDQWMIGSALLVKPVTESGATSVSVLLPKISDRCGFAGASLPWYELESLKQVVYPSSGGEAVSFAVDLSSIPVFLRPGSIIPRKMRLRRSSKLMFYDPYTLVITAGECGRAEGSLYLDDETSYAHEEANMFAVKKYVFTGTDLISSPAKPSFYSINKGATLVPSPKFTAINMVERIVIGGQSKAPKRVTATVVSKEGGGSSSTSEGVVVDLAFGYDKENKIIVVKKPGVKVIDDWTIHFEF